MNILLRIAAGLVGLVLTLLFIVFSFGVALVAFAAIGVVYAIQRRRGRGFNYWHALITATMAAGLFVPVAGGILVTQTKTGRDIWSAAKQGMEEAAAHPAPPPRILRDLPYAQTPPVTFQGPFAPVMFAVAFGLAGAFYGVLAWGGGALILFAFRGQFQSRQPDHPLGADDEAQSEGSDRNLADGAHGERSQAKL